MGHYDAFGKEEPGVKVLISEPFKKTKKYSSGGFDVELDADETREWLSENGQRELAVQVKVYRVPKKVAWFKIGKTEIYRGSKRLPRAAQSYDGEPNRKMLESLIEEASGAAYKKLGGGEYPDSAMEVPATLHPAMRMALLESMANGVKAKETRKMFREKLVEELSAITGVALTE